MRGLLVVLVLAVVGVIAVGYYRDWFKVGAANDSKTVNVNVTVNKEKVKEDEEKAKQKLKEVGGQIKEKTGEIIGGAKKGAGGENARRLVLSKALASKVRNRAMKLPRNLGMVLLAVWLIATGALPLLQITFVRGPVMEILAIAAGILLLLGR